MRLDFGAHESVRGAEKVGRNMADEELVLAAIEALEGCLGMLIEDAHDQAISMVPEELATRLDRIRMLQQVGTDVVTLTQACEVLLRWRAQAAGDPS